ncbi:Adenylyltransferase and sulfurtransferase UBA4 [Spathaspora sp. JA1]|nr:Adenylyltransferase and sulfurtransferase UBA4 [Spathaspora sp. JA1]
MTAPTTKELLERIAALELENSRLRDNQTPQQELPKPSSSSNTTNTLSLEEYKRYGRQMIVPQFGSLPSQLRLKQSKILVVGAGGLGCPALLYLSAAGIGTIGIVDDDVVDISNLHRQVLHTSDNVGMHKCESAKRYITRLNPHVDVETYPMRLNNDNAFSIISKYDLVLDCTDHPAIRYLINDVCVILNKTIVSGSGLKSDGQLSVLNFQTQGPCYRCFYPQPPSPDSVTSCSDGGVIGPAIGLVGTSMAVETIKILTGYYTSDNFKPFLSVYSGYPYQQFRMFKMRGKQKNCVVCGENPSVTREKIESNELNYSVFCGRVTFPTLENQYRISPSEYNQSFQNKEKHVLIDVRPKEQFSITSLPNSVNIEWDPIFRKANSLTEYLPAGTSKDDSIVVVCRYGNDSQLAVRKLQDLHYSNVKDIIGGLSKWSEDVDQSIPQY